MSNTTRAKINIKEGMIELDGSEDFVSRYLNEFKSLIDHKDIHIPKDDKIEANKPRKKEEAQSKKGTKAPSIQVEEFEVKAGEKTLKEFFESKNPPRDKGSARIAVIAYYITHYAKITEFTEGHIEFAFKTLSLPKRPAHLRQVLINIKNDQKFLEPGETEGKWKLSRIGELFVEDKLPPQKENK